MRRFLCLLVLTALPAGAGAQDVPSPSGPGLRPPGIAPSDPAPAESLPSRPVPPAATPDGDAGSRKGSAQAPREQAARESLDALFDRLKGAQDDTEAKGVAGLIERRWLRSGSDTADLLMSRAIQAIAHKDAALGIELLDRTIALEPDWAEAWNRRAAAFYLLDDPVAAIADLNRAIRLEPRHFPAWTGLGHIFKASGQDEQALLCYERALALNPRQEDLKDMVDKLRRDVRGVDL